MKPTKQPEDHIRCPVCLETYRFTKCRVSLYKDGKRYEICLGCGAKENRPPRP